MRLKTQLIVMLVLATIISCTSAQSNENKTNTITQNTSNTIESSLIHYEGELCNLQVENTFYEGPNPDYFYIKVEIKNTTNKVIGIDLKDKWKIIYPNQWGNLYTPERNLIDEIRIIPDELDDLKMTQLISDFKNDSLEFLNPNESFTYFTEFNSNGKAKIDETKEVGNFFYLSLDGQLFLTNGSKCERVCFEEDSLWQQNSILTKPLNWNKIKDESQIIERD